MTYLKAPNAPRIEKQFRDIIKNNRAKEKNFQIQGDKEPEESNWMNRFRNWYGTKNRVPEDEKNWFVKKTFDIVQAIKGKMKERGNSKQSEDENMHEQ